MNASSGGAGFSLIEVMIAILILGVGLVGLVDGITAALRSSKESERQTTAALLAAGQMETLRAEGSPEAGTTEGDCGEDLPGYRWKKTITNTRTTGLFRVEVAVEEAESGQSIYDLTTLLFDPDSYAGSTPTQTGGGSRRSRRRKGRQP